MMDENDMEIKRLRQVHHAKCLKIFLVGKVMRVIKAENNFIG